ncbi:TRAF-like protein [Jimgerdemannia flammicorona]|uniref:TRAF-like protein n=1 Tax=Jimgerdemannia flammicorona TaxID=994334 RepID=A0A433DIG1_9FUNG|nr:TRAF-like protein [Jimgerdemannia flammicorona]
MSAGRPGTIWPGDGASRALMLKMMSHFDLTLVCPPRLKTFTEAVDTFAETSPHYIAFCHQACKNTICPTRQILPDIDHDVEDFQIFHWKIESWRALTGRILSPEFEAGGWKWNILLYPLGNNQEEYTSMYLQLADPGPAEQEKYSCAQFGLVMSNPFDPTQLEHHNSHHRFGADEPDWGFTRFYNINEIFQPNNGRSHPLVDDDQTVISAFVRVLKDPTGVLWLNFVSYDSKKVTGFVGLINEGATDYLNTVVQCLYMIKYFRKSVYKIPTESDESTKNVALSLQREFYNLQFSEEAVGTTELTNFGTSIACDFLEFNCILQENLESKMKNTPADGDMEKLFVGKIKTYSKNINADVEFSRVDDFYSKLRMRYLRITNVLEY